MRNSFINLVALTRIQSLYKRRDVWAAFAPQFGYSMNEPWWSQTQYEQSGVTGRKIKTTMMQQILQIVRSETVTDEDTSFDLVEKNNNEHPPPPPSPRLGLIDINLAPRLLPTPIVHARFA